MSEKQSVISLITNNLIEVSDARLYDNARAMTDYYDELSATKELLYKTVVESNLYYSGGLFWFFTGRIYETVDRNLLYLAIEHFLRRMAVRNKIVEKEMNKFVDATFKRLSTEERKRFMPKYNVHAFTNGVVNLLTGEMSPFSPEFHVTYIHPYPYDRSAKCPIWHGFLKQVLPEKESRLVLQMFLGWCLYERTPRNIEDYEHRKKASASELDKCLILYGDGSNGKSVIFKTVTGIFGKPNVSNMSLGALIRDEETAKKNMAMIDGKVINFCPELNMRDFAGREDMFKSICSGEPQYGKRLYKDQYEVTNIPRLIFNTNRIPKSTDDSHGYSRRFQYIVFNYIIPEELQNKHLAEDLVSEYSGILNWIINGAKYLKSNGFKLPKSPNSEKLRIKNEGGISATKVWARQRHIEDFFETGEEGCEWYTHKCLYDDMVRFARLNNFEPQSEAVFAKLLESYLNDALEKVNDIQQKGRRQRFKLTRRRRNQGIDYKFSMGLREELKKGFVSIFERCGEENQKLISDEMKSEFL